MKLKYIAIVIVSMLIIAILMSAIQETPKPTRSISIQGELICVTATPEITPTSTPLPTSTPSVIYKKGVVGSGINERASFNPAIVGANWWYDYIATYGPVNGWIPMVGSASYNSQMIIATAKRYSGYWLIFNEPDFASAMTPTQAAVVYYNVRKTILSVNTNSKFIVGGMWSLEESSKTWLKSMATEYQRLYDVRMLAEGYHAHLYLCGRDYSAWTYQKKIEFFRNWLNTNGLTGEFWLTETGCLSNDTTAQLMMKENKDWLKNTPFVDRYAWFAMQNLSGSGTLQTLSGLTVLGNLYK